MSNARTTRPRWHRLVTATAAGLVLTAASPAARADATAADANPVRVQLLSITDLHGYFGDYTTTVPGAHAGEATQTVGGGAYLAAHLNRLRDQAALPEANSILFSAGDDFSGWPTETAYFWNEPTIEYLNHIGVRFSTIGNHELDRNLDYLRHMMDGTCEGRPDGDLCFTDSTGERFAGADFDYYSANVVDGATGELVVKPYHVERVDDGHGGTLPVGFIHATTSGTPNEGLSYWPADQLRFLPEAAEINRYAAELQAQGVQAVVAVVHEGFAQVGDFYNDCTNPSGPMVEMNKQISPAVDAIVTGHWHALANCLLPDPAGNPRPVVEAANHGRLISEINLQLDPETGDVLRDRTTSTNHANTRTVTPDPEVLRMAQYWRDRAQQRRNEPVVDIAGDLARTSADAEESTLGNATADAFRWAAQQDGGADVGIVMPNTLLRDVTYAPTAGNAADAPGQVLFGELMVGVIHESGGFGAALTSGELTGRGLDQLLESQWQQAADGSVTFRPLAVSSNVSYRYDPTAPVGDRVDFGQVRIDGKPLKPNATYRVATLSKDFVTRYAVPGFSALLDAHHQHRTAYSGPDALAGYLRAHAPLAPPALDRIRAKP
ncbi:bifunctional metallophosphatase/5'-nucleotidase [Micromonospora globbae]|uniref:Bifunctional metallophosphatase/5'-nucleotidase n=1 Tax=Micromonospora globbae TaxID=1894969 RepID=A0A420EVH9_9ACTN|nr:bifunctional metallophosphatase/5'-nucleotidase [Micromonospora globbae]RKF24731.1 bifunctional metallophosphatase/5'-nucleotidase [Micromonospora globbae]